MTEWIEGAFEDGRLLVVDRWVETSRFVDVCGVFAAVWKAASDIDGVDVDCGEEGVSFESGRVFEGARLRRAVPTVLVVTREEVDATLRATERIELAEDSR